MTIKGGGVWRLMEKNILNFHFDYLHPSLIPQPIFAHRLSFSYLYILMYLYSYAQAWGQKGQNGGVGAPPDTPDGRRAN